MTINDLKEWIESHINDLGLPYKYNYNIGRFVEDQNNPENVIIAIKKGTGSVRPPFIRYNIYQVLIISAQYFMSAIDENGDDEDYSEDDPLINFGVSKPDKKMIKTPVNIWEDGELIADKLEEATTINIPKNSSSIKLISSKAGPFYLSDGRIYFSISFEIIEV